MADIECHRHDYHEPSCPECRAEIAAAKRTPWFPGALSTQGMPMTTPNNPSGEAERVEKLARELFDLSVHSVITDPIDEYRTLARHMLALLQDERDRALENADEAMFKCCDSEGSIAPSDAHDAIRALKERGR